MTNPVGRPPAYKTPAEMQKVIDEYFETDAFFKNGEVLEFRPTISGLAYALDLTTHCLRNYEVKEEFITTVKKAKQLVELAMEQRLYGNNVTGLIFNLKNNFGWKDKTEIDNTSSDGTMTPTVIQRTIVKSGDA